ncbi:hypothetical protein FPOAC1_007424 [Fusarium poae]|uniref:hypothetical protein n=1 Tax=Fusarium poae TaxID=36050 RepID=UPI001CEB3A3F|nr:hypothetical protein FPOAC1_007424 [Fusarium poae]KAG8668061.1 hypothetical protein FPOAC1_007424 [Fusarium poae]
MKTTNIVLGLQSAVVCAAFTLPDNLPNGVYHAHVDAQGLEVTDGVTVDYNTTVTPQKTTRQLKSRQTKDEGGWDRDQPEMWCGCGLSMNHGNCDTAVDMLKAQFSNSDGGVGEVTQAWYSIWGDVCGCGIKDQILISQIDDFLKRVSKDTQNLFPQLDKTDSCCLIYHVYGEYGVISPLERHVAANPHEIAVLGDVVAPTQDMAYNIANNARASILHFSYLGQIASTGGFANPLPPHK